MENNATTPNRPRRFTRVLELLTLVWTITCAQAALETGSVTLAWDPNTEPDVAGYRLYYGSPAGTYNQMIDVGDVTSATVNGLAVGQVYSFHATCYNLSGLESDPSNSVEYTVPSTLPENQPPVAHALSLATDQNTPLDFTLTGSDPDGDTLTFQITTLPAYGTLDGTVPNLTYRPFTGFVGYDAFTFVVHDGFLASDPAIVSFTVAPVDDPADPDAPPRIIRTTIESDAVIVTWTSVVDATYVLLYKENLADPAWVPLTDELVATGPETAYTDRTAESALDRRYYAVMRIE